MADPKKWIKLWVHNLYDPNIAKLPDWLWRRKIEFDLMAGERNEDGALPPVEDMLWTLRLDEAKLSQALQMLAEVGEVQEDPPGSGQWVMTNFSIQQETPAADRMRKKRERDREMSRSNSTRNSYANSYRKSDEEKDRNSSSTSYSSSDSPSSSDSDSVSSSGLESILDSWNWQPRTPKEAVEHPALQIFQRVAGGMPGERDYNKAIQWILLIARKYQLSPDQLADYLAPYCLHWTSQVGQNGRNYDALNVNWLQQAFNRASLDPAPPRNQAGKSKAMSALDKIEQEMRENQKLWDSYHYPEN